MTHSFAKLLGSAVLFVAVPVAMAQTATPAPQAAVDFKDPAALLKAARATNGLEGDDLKPWHLKASYELFDDDGKPLGNGVFEEWWLTKDKWKQSFAGGHYTGTIYHSSEGTALEGRPLPWPESVIPDAVIATIPDKVDAGLKFSSPHKKRDPQESLFCVDVSEKQSPFPPQYGPDAYCFDEGTTNLRVRKHY